MTSQVPSPGNNYLVNFTDTYSEIDIHIADWPSPETKSWINPCSISVKPFIPCDSMTPLFLDKVNPTGIDQCFFKLGCDSYVILLELEPKHLANFSEVSKCCYMATKSDFIWHFQLKNLLPNVCCLSKFTCFFKPEQQFQIAFKSMNDRKKPFIEQAKHYFEKVAEMQIDLHNLSQITQDPNILQTAMYEIQYYVGSNYDGSLESIAPDSKLGVCLNALKLMPFMEFGTQDMFEIIIQTSETARQNPRLDNEVQVEEVIDGDI